MELIVDIKKKLQGVTLDVSFEYKGNCLGILGASGCGKSMTLKCIAGIERPDEGRIILDGQVFFDSHWKVNLPPRKRNIGYLFQNYALFPTMTVEENIGVGVKEKQEKKKVVGKQIEKFCLQGLEKRYPGQLSGGQQQRVALARIMAYNPDIILLDEPFSALDGYLKDNLQEEMLKTLEGYQGITILVSHSRDEIYRFSDTLNIMDGGKLTARGNTKELFQNPKNVGAARLTGCKNISTIRKISDYELEAIDWNITLRTAEMIGDHITHVGIRGHRIRPESDASVENAMKIKLIKIIEAPFEERYIIRNANKEASSEIWWIEPHYEFDTKEVNKLPQCVIFPPEQLVLLEE